LEDGDYAVCKATRGSTFDAVRTLTHGRREGLLLYEDEIRSVEGPDAGRLK